MYNRYLPCVSIQASEVEEEEEEEEVKKKIRRACMHALDVNTNTYNNNHKSHTTKWENQGVHTDEETTKTVGRKREKLKS